MMNNGVWSMKDNELWKWILKFLLIDYLKRRYEKTGGGEMANNNYIIL